MCEYAEHTFKLSVPDQNGVTQREHLEQVAVQTGHTPEELIGPAFPLPLTYVWSAFVEMSSARGQGFSGPLPLAYSEIKAYSEMTGTVFKPWEVNALKDLDRVYVRVANG